MTFPHNPQPGPRPGPPPGGFRPAPPPAGEFRPAPSPAPPQPYAAESERAERAERQIVEATGHPAVDAALRSLANASQLAPGEQIAAYEAAHQVLQETLSSIEG